MEVIFKPLLKTHFPLLLKWLEKTHVKVWWDQNIVWTKELIQTKYFTYVKGYKLENDIRKDIMAYIIYADQKPVGYIQIYNAYDFARGYELKDLPASLCAFDIFIGEEDYLGKGLGSLVLNIFIDDICPKKYTHIFADPDIANIVAAKTYQKAGFNVVFQNDKVLWMTRKIKKI